MYDILKTSQEYQHYENTNFSKRSMTSKVIQGHLRHPVQKICLWTNFDQNLYEYEDTFFSWRSFVIFLL